MCKWRVARRAHAEQVPLVPISKVKRLTPWRHPRVHTHTYDTYHWCNLCAIPLVCGVERDDRTCGRHLRPNSEFTSNSAASPTPSWHSHTHSHSLTRTPCIPMQCMTICVCADITCVPLPDSAVAPSSPCSSSSGTRLGSARLGSSCVARAGGGRSLDACHRMRNTRSAYLYTEARTDVSFGGVCTGGQRRQLHAAASPPIDSRRCSRDAPCSPSARDIPRRSPAVGGASSSSAAASSSHSATRHSCADRLDATDHAAR